MAELSAERRERILQAMAQCVVEEGIRAGHGIEAFRAFENAREEHALAAAAAELPAMLAALWEKLAGR